MQEAISSFPKPICAVASKLLHGLALVALLACDLRVATQECVVDLQREDSSTLVFDLTDGLPRVVGPAEAESLRLKRPILAATTAMEIKLFHCILPDMDSGEAAAVEQLTTGSGWNRIITKTAPDAADLAERCFTLAQELKDPTTIMAMQSECALEVVIEDSVLHVHIRQSLTKSVILAVAEVLRPTQMLHVFHMHNTEDDAEEESPEVEELALLAALVQRCELPVLAVCTTEFVSGSEPALIAMADIAILAEETMVTVFQAAHLASSIVTHLVAQRISPRICKNILLTPLTLTAQQALEVSDPDSIACISRLFCSDHVLLLPALRSSLLTRYYPEKISNATPSSY